MHANRGPAGSSQGSKYSSKEFTDVSRAEQQVTRQKTISSVSLEVLKGSIFGSMHLRFLYYLSLSQTNGEKKK